MSRCRLICLDNSSRSKYRRESIFILWILPWWYFGLKQLLTPRNKSYVYVAGAKTQPNTEIADGPGDLARFFLLCSCLHAKLYQDGRQSYLLANIMEWRWKIAIRMEIRKCFFAFLPCVEPLLHHFYYEMKFNINQKCKKKMNIY